MTKILINKKIFILLVLVVMTLSLAACFSSEKNKGNSNQPPVSSNPQLEREYEKSVKEILKPFWPDNQIIGLPEQILALRAPAKYLDLHLNLVFAFDLISQGQQEADQAKIETGLEKLHQLKDQYSWLN